MEKKITRKKKVVEEVAVAVAPAPVEPKKDEKAFATYILMFTIEGHKTWRVSLFSKKEDLEVYLSKQPKHPKITEKRWFACDRITGTIIQEK